MLSPAVELHVVHTRDVAPNGVVIVSNLQLFTLVFCVVLVFIASQRLQLRIERSLAVAALRCVIQLSLLGLILVPILLYNFPPLVLGYITLMMLVAAVEAAARPPYMFDAMVVVCFVSITATVAVFGTFCFVLVLGTGLDAQYAIPITGMITGQAMSAVSVAISNLVTEFAERKSNIEIMLALGATRWEASIDIVRSSIVLGLTPTLNTMSVTGLVSIPGMMTGQIIGGTPPALAAKYQLVIMYVSSGTATVATLTASILTVYALIDNQHRVRGERLYSNDKVNRFDSIVSTVRYLTSSLIRWHGTVQQRDSPFPDNVHEPVAINCSATDNIPFPKNRGGLPEYGATSRLAGDLENR